MVRPSGRGGHEPLRVDFQEFEGAEREPRETISFFVNCETQDEVDAFWAKLGAGGERGRCGWLKDKFGLSWQIIPSALRTLMSDPDPAKSQAVVQAMLKMNKIVVADLQSAYDSAPVSLPK